MNTIKIHTNDNVAVVLTALKSEGTDIAAGHKIALSDIKKGEKIIKYGCPIGHATCDIPSGAWVHTHNMATDLSEHCEYIYKPDTVRHEARQAASFEGFLRSDGRAAVRNELWVLPLVGCVNSVAQRMAAENQNLVTGTVEGLFAFAHPYGCSQMGDDHERTRRILAALAQHPNAGGVLILGLGCENLTLEQFKAELGEYDENRVKFLMCQDVDDEYAIGAKLLSELAASTGKAVRQPLPASKLVIGMKCGGSDGLSGVTANPAVGAFTDILVSQGGTSILTEVPEMFGAEQILFDRCENETVFNKAVAMAEDFKNYFVSHGQTVYENPSPGNKAGGISTLEDKSCGCVQKGGSAVVTDVIEYGATVKKQGLILLSGPGNDLVSATALTAAGAHIILFTTGRGTPFGAPAPTVKISSNSALYERKRSWMDFDAGTIASGESVLKAGERLFEYVLAVASGEKTRAEQNGFREISIFKGGVTL